MNCVMYEVKYNVQLSMFVVVRIKRGKNNAFTLGVPGKLVRIRVSREIHFKKYKALKSHV